MTNLEPKLEPNFKLNVKRAWLVVGGTDMEIDDMDQLAQWKREHPNFITWTQDWFEKEFVHTGLSIADDSSSYGSGGDTLLFTTKEAALRYGEREAVIASGIRMVEPVLSVTVPVSSDFLEEYEDEYFDTFVESLSDTIGKLGNLKAVLADDTLVCFSADENGKNEIIRLAQEFGIQNRITWPT